MGGYGDERNSAKSGKGKGGRKGILKRPINHKVGRARCERRVERTNTPKATESAIALDGLVTFPDISPEKLCPPEKVV